MDEAGGAIGGMVNTLTDVAMIEGFMDTLGPFNPGNVAAEVLNYGGFSDRPGDIRARWARGPTSTGWAGWAPSRRRSSATSS